MRSFLLLGLVCLSLALQAVNYQFGTSLEKLVVSGDTVNNDNLEQLKSATAGYSWKTSSLLASGKWIKIRTKSRGIYKISYDQLRAWGFSNPEKVGLYGNGGFMLPILNKDLKTDDLMSYPVIRGKDNAGKDCLFFYATGNVQINQKASSAHISHQQNYYSTETYFYLSEQGTPKLIERAAELTENAGRQVKSFQNYTFYEKELLNLISSGSQWFGERFMQGASHNITIALENPDLSKPANFVIAAAARSSEPSRIDVILNSKPIGSVDFQATAVSDATANFAIESVKDTTQLITSGTISLRLTYNAANGSSDAWLDYIGVNYQSPLSISSDVLIFRGKGVEGNVLASEFVLDKATSGIKILNVTDPFNVVEVPATFSDNQLKFKSNSFVMNDYVAFNPSGASILVPEQVGEVVNQNLHSGDLCEMIIVTHPRFVNVANELADFRRTNDQMTVQVVTPEQIYNEFSSGMPDPAAFRNYFRMCYDRGKQSGANTLKYILLLGDGSFDNRNIQGKGNNLLPTYQSSNSLSPTESFVTDDFFVMLDENEGGYNGIIDLGIGRIPATTLDEAQIVLEKIKNYHQQEAQGSWRNVVTFIGDDGDNSTHMDQADRLANYVNRNFPAFFTDKIYFDAYRQLSTSGGEKYPEVTDAINNRIKQGTLLLNYTGHANEKNLADENVVDIGVINSWNNYKRLPIFVTATCEFSRFDSNEKSAGEHFLFNPVGGGVGLFSTTRLVYSGANFVLNDQFFRHVFLKDEKGQNLRMGDVMRLAKAKANTGVNQLNFTLLADPSLRLAYPHLQVKTTSINGKSVEAEIDTIKTLAVVTIKGMVTDHKGAKLSTFNGEIIPTVYDKVMPVKTLGNAGEEQMEYTVQNSMIYRGLASVVNGEFEFSFFVPKDVSYKVDKGKILYYAYNETDDAQGYFDGFMLGGSSNSSITDNAGPEIELFLNSVSFKDGGRVSASSVLIAKIKDVTGINTAGIGIGHDITAVLDGDDSNIFVLNDYFQASKDKYTEGTIVFPLNKLSEGEHVLRLKVWDVLNNSSEKEIRFVVRDDFRIENVANYPNPMSEQTSFVFEHNQPDETFDVTLEIFQTTGSRVDIVQKKVGSQGTESLPIEWMPSSRQIRMVPGIYIYRITATANGKTTSGSGRLVYTHR
jgi:protein involved in ribonucleotide reduction